MARLFISYARRDAAVLAEQLHSALAGDHDVWLDREQIEGGAAWSREIEDEIDSCDVLLALLSPGAFESPICRGEQCRALRKKKRVIPVLAAPGADRPVYLEVSNYRDLSAEKHFDEQLAALRGDLSRWRTLPVVAVAPQDAESAPPPTITHAVDRPEITLAARALLLQEVAGRAIVVTVLNGFPGIGKTTLAAHLCHDERVRDAFPDGVVWVDVGRDACNPRLLAHTALRALGGGSTGVLSVERARGALSELLATKSVLVVLDDVWWYEQVEPFIVDAPRSRLLVTSRTRVVGSELGARHLELPAMSDIEAVELLAKWTGRDDPTLPDIAERLHRLPIALRIAGSQLARERNSAAWLARLEHASRLVTSTRAAGHRERDLTACLDLSVLELAHEQADPPRSDARPFFEALGIFPQDVAVPRTIVQRLWSSLEPKRSDGDWAILLTELDELGLIDLPDDAIGLHDILLDYCQIRLGSRAAALHESLLRSYQPSIAVSWSNVNDDGYLYDHLAHHLIAARGAKALADLLREEDPENRTRNAWYHARLSRGQLLGYLADIETARRGCATVACDARFGLMLSSLRSRAGNAPPALLLALVKQGLWPVERAAAYASELTDSVDRVEALLLLGKRGSRDLLRQAGKMLPLVGAEFRDSLAQRVAQALDSAGDAEAALHVAASISDRDVLCDTLAKVLPASDNAELGHKADYALGRLDQNRRMRALYALVRRTTANRSALLARALGELHGMRAEGVAEAYARISSGAPLIPYLPEGDRAAFLEQAFGTLSSEVALGFLPTNLLEVLAPYLDLEWSRRAFALVREWRATARHPIELAKRQAEAMLLLRGGLEPSVRLEAADYLLSEPIDPIEIGEVIAACIELDPGRREELLVAALATVRGLRDQPYGTGHLKSHALYELRAYITGTHLEEALKIAVEIEEDKYRYEALLTLAESCEGPETLATILREARRLSKDEREGLERRCRITAIVLPRLTREERRSQLGEPLAALDITDPEGFFATSWESRMHLLPFMEDAEEAEERIERMIPEILTRKSGDTYAVSEFAKRLPRRFHSRVVDQALGHGEVGPRRQLVAALAPLLSADSLHMIAGRLDAIGDAAVQAETSNALRAVIESAGDASGETLELLLLEEISKDIGTSWDEAVCWIHRLVATRLAERGQTERALVVLRQLQGYDAIYPFALADVARYLPPKIIHAEVKQRMDAARPDEATTSDWALGRPQNLVPLLRYAESAMCLAIRDETLGRGVTERGQSWHYAHFVPAILDDRAEVIRRFLDFLDDERTTKSEMEIVEVLVPYADSEELTHFAASVDRGDSTEETTARAALAIAARDSSRMWWALEKLGRLDKPYRTPCAALCAAAFSGRERATLSAETLGYARAWSRQQESIGPLCLAAVIAPGESGRKEILREALIATVRFPNSNLMRHSLSRVAAYLCLLLDESRQPLVRLVLELASGQVRERLLRTLSGLRFAIRWGSTPCEMAEIDRAIADCGRWWP
jgi:hypothetical protein